MHTDVYTNNISYHYWPGILSLNIQLLRMNCTTSWTCSRRVGGCQVSFLSNIVIQVKLCVWYFPGNKNATWVLWLRCLYSFLLWLWPVLCFCAEWGSRVVDCATAEMGLIFFFKKKGGKQQFTRLTKPFSCCTNLVHAGNFFISGASKTSHWPNWSGMAMNFTASFCVNQ